MFVFWVAFLVWALQRFLAASLPVAIWFGKVGLGGDFVPVTEKVVFKTHAQLVLGARQPYLVEKNDVTTLCMITLKYLKNSMC